MDPDLKELLIALTVANRSLSNLIEKQWMFTSRELTIFNKAIDEMVKQGEKVTKIVKFQTQARDHLDKILPFRDDRFKPFEPSKPSDN